MTTHRPKYINLTSNIVKKRPETTTSATRTSAYNVYVNNRQPIRTSTKKYSSIDRCTHQILY